VARDKGLGMGAFFAAKPEVKRPPAAKPQAKIRTTIRLTREEADLLELLRMKRRNQRGRNTTYGDVLGEAIRHLAVREEVSNGIEQ
jgi:hypothetical protein